MLTTSKRILVLISFLFILMAAANAQGSRPEKKGKEPSKIGWGVNIGNIRFYNNFFQFGLAPNIAYRISDPLAVGFMLKTDYYYQRYPQYDLKFSTFDLGPTVFARWKPLWETDGATPFLQGLFIQAEYERAFIRRAEDQFGNIFVNGDKIDPIKTEEDYVYIGLGATSGYPFSSFFSIHYNVIDKPELSRIPFNYRVGFTFHY